MNIDYDMDTDLDIVAQSPFLLQYQGEEDGDDLDKAKAAFDVTTRSFAELFDKGLDFEVSLGPFALDTRPQEDAVKEFLDRRMGPVPSNF